MSAWSGIDRGSVDVTTDVQSPLVATNMRFCRDGEVSRRLGMTRTNIAKADGPVLGISGFSPRPQFPCVNVFTGTFFGFDNVAGAFQGGDITEPDYVTSYSATGIILTDGETTVYTANGTYYKSVYNQSLSMWCICTASAMTFVNRDGSVAYGPFAMPEAGVATFIGVVFSNASTVVCLVKNATNMNVWSMTAFSGTWSAGASTPIVGPFVYVDSDYDGKIVAWTESNYANPTTTARVKWVTQSGLVSSSSDITTPFSGAEVFRCVVGNGSAKLPYTTGDYYLFNFRNYTGTRGVYTLYYTPSNTGKSTYITASVPRIGQYAKGGFVDMYIMVVNGNFSSANLAGSVNQDITGISSELRPATFAWMQNDPSNLYMIYNDGTSLWLLRDGNPLYTIPSLNNFVVSEA